MLPPGKSVSPLMSPAGGLRKTPMASPLSPYHNGGSILRSPVTNHAQSPGTLPTTFSPGRSPVSQTPVRSSPTSSWVSGRRVMIFMSFLHALEILVLHCHAHCCVASFIGLEEFLPKSIEIVVRAKPKSSGGNNPS